MSISSLRRLPAPELRIWSLWARLLARRCSALLCSTPTCGHTVKENRKNQVVFQCVKCGHTANADVNAAKNILAAGQAVSGLETSPQTCRHGLGRGGGIVELGGPANRQLGGTGAAA